MMDAVYTWARSKGFWLDTSNMNIDSQHYEEMTQLEKTRKLCLIHSEISECLESIRKPKYDDHIPEFTNETVELADACIRIFDYAARYDLPLAQAILAKYKYNQGRPHMHGKAF